MPDLKCGKFEIKNPVQTLLAIETALNILKKGRTTEVDTPNYIIKGNVFKIQNTERKAISILIMEP